MNELKVKPDLELKFDARDVIDVLVSEQEQNIEDQVNNLKAKLEATKEEAKKSDDDIEQYKKEFVKVMFGGKISLMSKTLKDMGLNAAVDFEIMEGNDLPTSVRTGRHRVVLSMNPEHQSKENKIIVALVISNKEFDRSTVDSSITFHMESDYDEKLKELKKVNEDLLAIMKQTKDKIDELEKILSGTDRLVRKAKAAVTKKALPEDMTVFLDDFKKNLSDVNLKQIEIKTDNK